MDLQLPDSPEYKAKRALMGLLTTDPLLCSTVKPGSFLFYEGENVDDSDPDNIPRPFVRITIKPGPSAWFSEGQHKFAMAIAIELGVDGLRDRNILNLWHACRMAVSPNRMSPDCKQTIMAVLHGGGISNIMFDDCPYAIIGAGSGKVRWLYAMGSFTATIFVNT